MARRAKATERDILRRLGLDAPGAIDKWIKAQLRELGEPEPAEGGNRELRKYIARLAKLPPSCIASCAAPATAADRKALVKQYGDMITLFTVQRGTGTKRAEAFPVWGVPSEDPPLRDPVYVGGPTIAAAVFWFDSRQHGYDGEFGHLKGRRAGTPNPYRCPKCRNDQFRVTVLFQYSGDNEELDKPEQLARIQDFFCWFALRGTCAKCGHTAELASVECA